MPTMGAWGTGPFENDIAGDFMDGCEEGLTKKVHQAASALAAPYSLREEGRAALAALRALYRAGLIVGVGVFTDGEELLQDMLDDDQWLGAWQSPAAIKARLRNELHETRTLVRSIRRRAFFVGAGGGRRAAGAPGLRR